MQVTWRGLGPGEIRVHDGGEPRVAAITDGTGAVEVDGLAGPVVDVEVLAGGWRHRQRVALLPRPPGQPLLRLATLNDLHIGERAFGLRRRMRETAPAVPYPDRALEAALDEISRWGAEALVLKGDLTDLGRPRQWERLAALLEPVGIPVLAVLGNHDVARRSIDGTRVLEAAGVQVARQVAAHDLGGVRIILLPTAVPGWNRGRVPASARRRTCDLAAGAPGPVLVAMHHQPQRFRVRTYHPPGIPGPEAAALLDDLGEARPGAVVVTGHSHRYRVRTRGAVTVAEVGSDKDYPGGWAGYEIYDGGLTQVVRRTARPDVIEWTERTRMAVGGVWGVWSTGALDDRCWSKAW